MSSLTIKKAINIVGGTVWAVRWTGADSLELAKKHHDLHQSEHSILMGLDQ